MLLVRNWPRAEWEPKTSLEQPRGQQRLPAQTFNYRILRLMKPRWGLEIALQTPTVSEIRMQNTSTYLTSSFSRNANVPNSNVIPKFAENYAELHHVSTISKCFWHDVLMSDDQVPTKHKLRHNNEMTKALRKLRKHVTQHSTGNGKAGLGCSAQHLLIRKWLMNRKITTKICHSRQD